MKEAFGGKKAAGAPLPPGTSAGRLGTASRAAAAAAQQQMSGIGAPPGSASRRLQTGVAGQRRPTTAAQAAGFTTGALGSSTSTSASTQFEKKEET